MVISTLLLKAGDTQAEFSLTQSYKWLKNWTISIKENPICSLFYYNDQQFCFLKYFLLINLKKKIQTVSHLKKKGIKTILKKDWPINGE